MCPFRNHDFPDISIKNIDNAVNDISMRTNNLMADFSYAESTTLSLLYNSYLWRLNNKSFERF